MRPKIHANDTQIAVALRNSGIRTVAELRQKYKCDMEKICNELNITNQRKVFLLCKNFFNRNDDLLSPKKERTTKRPQRLNSQEWLLSARSKGARQRPQEEKQVTVKTSNQYVEGIKKIIEQREIKIERSRQKKESLIKRQSIDHIDDRVSCDTNRKIESKGNINEGTESKTNDSEYIDNSKECDKLKLNVNVTRDTIVRTAHVFNKTKAATNVERANEHSMKLNNLEERDEHRNNQKSEKNNCGENEVGDTEKTDREKQNDMADDNLSKRLTAMRRMNIDEENINRENDASKDENEPVDTEKGDNINSNNTADENLLKRKTDTEKTNGCEQRSRFSKQDDRTELNERLSQKKESVVEVQILKYFDDTVMIDTNRKIESESNINESKTQDSEYTDNLKDCNELKLNSNLRKDTPERKAYVFDKTNAETNIKRSNVNAIETKNREEGDERSESAFSKRSEKIDGDENEVDDTEKGECEKRNDIAKNNLLKRKTSMRKLNIEEEHENRNKDASKKDENELVDIEKDENINRNGKAEENLLKRETVMKESKECDQKLGYSTQNDKTDLNDKSRQKKESIIETQSFEHIDDGVGCDMNRKMESESNFNEGTKPKTEESEYTDSLKDFNELKLNANLTRDTIERKAFAFDKTKAFKNINSAYVNMMKTNIFEKGDERSDSALSMKSETNDGDENEVGDTERKDREKKNAMTDEKVSKRKIAMRKLKNEEADKNREHDANQEDKNELLDTENGDNINRNDMTDENSLKRKNVTKKRNECDQRSRYSRQDDKIDLNDIEYDHQSDNVNEYETTDSVFNRRQCHTEKTSIGVEISETDNHIQDMKYTYLRENIKHTQKNIAIHSDDDDSAQDDTDKEDSGEREDKHDNEMENIYENSDTETGKEGETDFTNSNVNRSCESSPREKTMINEEQNEFKDTDIENEKGDKEMDMTSSDVNENSESSECKKTTRTSKYEDETDYSDKDTAADYEAKEETESTADQYDSDTGNETDSKENDNSSNFEDKSAENVKIQDDPVHENEDDVNSDNTAPSMTRFDIVFSYKEWKRLRPTKNKPNKLNASWTDAFAEKVNEKVPGCVLTFKYHNINREVANKSTYFNAQAHCKHDGCGIFRFVRVKVPERKKDVEINVEIMRQVKVHEAGDVYKRKLKGVKRKLIQKKLESNAPSNIFYQEMSRMPEQAIKSGNFTTCQSKDVLRKAKSEWNVHDALHRDPFTELTLVQEILKEEDDRSKTVKGYIQEIGYVPFSVVMYKEDSLNVAREAIKAKQPFYFDATGTVVAKTNNSNKILYYAMVVTGRTKGQPPVPVLEFLSDQHGTYSIVKPLLSFVSELHKSCGRQIKPIRVECDFSWAIIHSLLLSFNKISIEEYLKLTFVLCNQERYDPCSSKKFTVVHLCCTHMLKAVRDALKDRVKDKRMRELALRFFALLQNCVKLNETTLIWKTMCIVFGSMYKSLQVEEASKTMDKMVMSASLKGLEADLVCDMPLTVTDNSESAHQTGIRAGSPFSGLYKDILTDVQDESIDKTDTTVNEYYNPDVLGLFVSNYLPLIPLWSGLLLGSPTRDSNASVENWMKILKIETLGRSKRLRVGKFVRTIHLTLKGRLKEHSLAPKRKTTADTEDSTLPPKKKRTAGDEQPEDATEGWARKDKANQDHTSFFYSPPKKVPTPKTKSTQKQSKVKPKNESNADGKNEDAGGIKSNRDSPPGLTNLGNTCWLNSTIQALAALRQHDITGDNEISVAVRRTLRQVKNPSARNQTLDIRQLAEAIERGMSDYTIGQMHDPLNLLSYIVPAETVFHSVLECYTCHQIEQRPEIVSLIHIEIPPRRQIVTVRDCLQEFSKKEILSGENTVYCEGCEEDTNHLKHIEVASVNPQHTVLHLKRYQITGGSLCKNSTPVVVNCLLALGCERLSVLRIAAIQKENALQSQRTKCDRTRYLPIHITVTIDETARMRRCDDARITQARSLSYIDSREVTDNSYYLFYEQIEVNNPYVDQHTAIGEIDGFISSVIRQADDDQVLATFRHYQITGQDIRTLDANRWVNDQIVNMYLSMVVEKYTNVSMIESFFFMDIQAGKSADKWIKPSTFQKDKVLVPVLNEGHWSLIVLDVMSSTIRTLHSMKKPRTSGSVALVRNYMEKSQACPSRWGIENVKGLPKQTNNDDCGIFTCQFAVNVARGYETLQTEIPMIRKAMQIEILTGTLLQRPEN